jgi:hypothetical protein
VLVVPSGFRPFQSSLSLVALLTSASAFKNFGLNANAGAVSRATGFVSVVDDYLSAVSMTWPTSDAWPTTLPGTATGTPN